LEKRSLVFSLFGSSTFEGAFDKKFPWIRENNTGRPENNTLGKEGFFQLMSRFIERFGLSEDELAKEVASQWG